MWRASDQLNTHLWTAYTLHPTSLGLDATFVTKKRIVTTRTLLVNKIESHFRCAWRAAMYGWLSSYSPNHAFWPYETKQDVLDSWRCVPHPACVSGHTCSINDCSAWTTLGLVLGVGRSSAQSTQVCPGSFSAKPADEGRTSEHALNYYNIGYLHCTMLSTARLELYDHSCQAVATDDAAIRGAQNFTLNQRRP